MPSNTIRKFIRHPSDVPIQVTLDWVEDDDVTDYSDQTLTNVSLGGLSFLSSEAIDILQRVRVSVPILKHENHLTGIVVWCTKRQGSFEIGLEFESTKEIFKLRMIEQICHIEHYRSEVERVEKRIISTEEAAQEWISKYAGDFPAL